MVSMQDGSGKTRMVDQRVVTVRDRCRSCAGGHQRRLTGTSGVAARASHPSQTRTFTLLTRSWEIPRLVLYVHNMEWSHSKKQIRGALDEALAVGLKVLPTTARGHSWGTSTAWTAQGGSTSGRRLKAPTFTPGRSASSSSVTVTPRKERRSHD
jgi:hypothetical protein